MIVDTVAFKLNSPDLIFESRPNRSGIKPEDKPIYLYAYPSSSYPVLILPKSISDDQGNSLPNGYYTVALSDDKKFLLLVQSCQLKAKIPVGKLVETELPEEEKAQEDEYKAKIEEYKYKRKLKKQREYEKELKDLYTRRQAKMSAEILDSGEDYYIIKYSNQQINAWGYITK